MLKADIQKYKDTKYRITGRTTISLYSWGTQNVLFLWGSSPWGHMSWQVHCNPVTTNTWTNYFYFPVEPYPACLVSTAQQVFFCSSALFSLTSPALPLPVLWASSLFSVAWGYHAAALPQPRGWQALPAAQTWSPPPASSTPPARNPVTHSYLGRSCNTYTGTLSP